MEDTETATGTGTTTTFADEVTTTSAGVLILQHFVTNANGAATPSSPQVELSDQPHGSSTISQETNYQIGGAAGNHTSTVTFSSVNANRVSKMFVVGWQAPPTSGWIIPVF